MNMVGLRTWTLWQNITVPILTGSGTLSHPKTAGFFICPSNRSIKALLINTWRALKILPKEKPDLIISSGAAPAIPFFWIGKLMGAKTIYIEVFDRIDASTIAGKLCYPVADKFIVEWEEMKKVYPKAVNLGSIF